MKKCICWLILAVLLFGSGLAVKDEMDLNDGQLSLNRLNYWGLQTKAIYKHVEVKQIDVRLYNMGGSFRSSLKYDLVLYDSKGTAIPLPKSLRLISTRRVEGLTKEFKRPVKQVNLKRIGYPHLIPLQLGVFPALIALLYALEYIKKKMGIGSDAKA